MTSSMAAQYCLKCGSQMEFKELEGYTRQVCPNCGWVHYPQLKVGGSALIEQEGNLLLLKRAQNPWRGWWNFPAGYTEVNEDPAQTAVRETKEETGLDVEVERLLSAYFFDDDPRGNGLMVLYKCHVIGGSLTQTTEALEAKYFSPEMLPENIAGGGHDLAVKAWLEGSFG